ncbi:Fucose permease [Sanguibacter gelidistatuariae]|uniref:Fucose permease n=1 Tax=Sanguibacter gelidistatuariae TaxID=1814289 RepID=A0A1G6J5X5_9MICO|nr:MFS transporter [Sanguibacter gelidistatuariae]SDC13705.1 Fucose permease [Sanguibacter gelidistatuariae]
MDPTTRRWRLALFATMFVAGLAMASWVSRTPAVRDAVDASTAQMGLVLFGLSVGSITGVVASGGLVRRHGGRPVITAGVTLIAAGMAVVGLGVLLGVAGGVFAGLALFGAGMGLCEIALNIEGAALEAALGAPVLATLHGCFSLGTVAGALLGIALTAADFPVVAHLVIVAVATAAVCAWGARAVPAGTGKAQPDDRAPSWRDQLTVWRDHRLVLIALIILAMAFAEGSANDWLPLLMVDGHGTSATTGSLIFAGFATAMTVGRFAGAMVLRRVSRSAVVRFCALLAAVGLALVIVVDNTVVAGVGVVLWGLGASLAFPVSISAAGDHPDSAVRVSAVATAGYFAFLVGPPTLGFLGEHVGLRGAMVLVLVCVLAASFVTPALRTPGGEGPAIVPDDVPAYPSETRT